MQIKSTDKTQLCIYQHKKMAITRNLHNTILDLFFCFLNHTYLTNLGKYQKKIQKIVILNVFYVPRAFTVQSDYIGYLKSALY